MSTVTKKFVNSIPIVLSSDDNYAKYLSVTVQSIIDNSSEVNNYEIFVLSENISIKSQKIISSQCDDYKNFHISFFDINSVLSTCAKKKFFVNQWFSVATYFRVYIPQILKNFDKCIYLDCDLVVNHDVSELYNCDISNLYLAAAQEIGVESAITANAEHKKYYLDKLGLESSKDYFQAGVLVLNLSKLREFNFEEKFISMVEKISEPRHVDQCIMNALFSKNHKKLPQEWNFVPGYFWNEVVIENYVTADTARDYYKASVQPKIIHYAGEGKPLYNKSLCYADIFWRYAMNSPFFGQLQEEYIASASSVTRKSGIRFFLEYKIEISRIIKRKTFRVFGVNISQSEFFKLQKVKKVKILYLTVYSKRNG